MDSIRSGPKRGGAAAYTGVRASYEGVDENNVSPATSHGSDDITFPSAPQQGKNYVSIEVNPPVQDPEARQGSTKSTVYFSAILLTAIIPLAGMLAWIITVKVRQGGDIFTGFTSAKIGGHLTQTQAKAIDFVCSALLAPLLMACLNFVWFACARVCVVNEHAPTHRGGAGVPLQSLARASRTAFGTYDLLGLWELFSAKTWRLSVLGAVALLSAISSSALGNIIAYESFREEGPSTGNYTLRMLSDDQIRGGGDSDNVLAAMGLLASPQKYSFDATQIDLAAHNMSTMLNGLPFENATLDNDGGYIGVNATEVSLDAIGSNVTSLHDVPGYRLTADCAPTKLTKNSFMMLYTELGWVQVTTSSNVTAAAASELDVPDPTLPTVMTYSWTGNPKDYFYDLRVDFEFLTFGTNQAAINLVYLIGGAARPETNSTVPITTAWGDLSPVYQNITVPSSGATYAYGTEAYALQCVLLRQEGLLEFRRRDDQSWAVAGSRFQDERKAVRSFLQDWQLHLTAERATPPLADVLWGGAPDVESCGRDASQGCLTHGDFSTAVNNLVFASGEATRITYNVAAVNASRGRAGYLYNVTGEVDRQFYRITYVPVLLLVALLGIIISAILVTVLVVATMKTWSWRTFRQVDITRLVVDCVGADLAKGDTSFSQLGRASDEELSEWASRYRIGYEKVVDVDEVDCDREPSVRLRHIAGGGTEKSGSYENVRSAEQSG